MTTLIPKVDELVWSTTPASSMRSVLRQIVFDETHWVLMQRNCIWTLREWATDRCAEHHAKRDELNRLIEALGPDGDEHARGAFESLREHHTAIAHRYTLVVYTCDHFL
jgi:hypothetical protein